VGEELGLFGVLFILSNKVFRCFHVQYDIDIICYFMNIARINLKVFEVSVRKL